MINYQDLLPFLHNKNGNYIPHNTSVESKIAITN
jgi:hypothetical protein